MNLSGLNKTYIDTVSAWKPNHRHTSSLPAEPAGISTWQLLAD